MITSLNLTFDAPVQLISYNIGYNNATNFGLTFTQGGNISAEGTNLGIGSRPFQNQFVATANTPIVLTNVSAPFATLQLKSITVDATAVSWETDALSMIGSTVLIGLGFWAKGKFAKPLQK